MSDTTVEPINSSNYQKFKTQNPVVRWMINNFYTRLTRIISGLEISDVLDAGCGEGESIERLRDLLPDKIVGFDVNEMSVRLAKQRFPSFSFDVYNIYDMPFAADSFDLIICFEVLEHLDHPEQALSDLLRVARKSLLVSVPHEPYFRIGSLLRGKYLYHFGNHPEHIQHWDRQSFEAFLRRFASYVHVEASFPWLIGHCRIVS